MDVHQTTAVRRKLLGWYDRNHRKLPWRMTRDPYRIWVSEIMLQQTRVQAVIPYYEKFLRRFPDVDTLAAASEQELLACWGGLGYYSRARNLKKAAQVIVRQHDSLFPWKLEDALSLPGIGPYTAAAVLSIAYGVALPVLDGNVARVLSRLYAVAADLRNNAGKRNLLEKAETLLSPKRPGDFNQALMELGATVCLPQQPHCNICPLRNNCRAFATNTVETYPPARRKAKPALRRFIAALILDGKGKCLLTRRPQKAQWMGGFWELPLKELSHPQESSKKKLPISEDGIRWGGLLGHVRHTITTNKLDVAVHQASLGRLPIPRREKWVALSQIARFPVTTITHKALRLSDPEDAR